MAKSKTRGRPSLRGRFLTFEGIDGCGKTTQAARVADRLHNAGLTVMVTREPGGTEIGRQLRSVLLNPDYSEIEPLAELLLFLADRVQHLREKIRPALARGEVVLCDRFHDATVAYQQYGRGLNLTPLQPFIDAEILNTPPDLTLWLDLSVALATARMGARNPIAQEWRFDAETERFHESVRLGYVTIARADPKRVARIAADGNEDEVHARIWAQLTERFDVA